MFGSKKKRDDLMSQLRPDLTREALGVGPDFPGVAPNPLLSREGRQRNAELRTGTLAIGRLVDWREINDNPRVLLIFDVDTAEGVSFRGVADEGLTITELTRLQPGQSFPVRYRPAVRDHYVALARDVPAAEVDVIAARIAQFRRY